MNYQAFYRELFAPLEARLGPLDPATLTGIVGFDAGGPVSLCTAGWTDGSGVVTYVTCELACRKAQFPSPLGRYELLTVCDDPDWAQTVLTGIGQMSLHTAFGPGHTLDLAPWVGAGAPIQGVIFEEYLRTSVPAPRFGVLPRRRPAAILRVYGVRRQELEFAIAHGVPALRARLEAAAEYPITRTRRGVTVPLDA